MNLFVGRQPILDRDLRTYGYELLFRSSETNQCDAADADAATAVVLSNTFLSVGAAKILGDCKGFVNLPRQLLADEVVRVLPHETIVIEVLEDVIPDDQVIQACRNLKDAGYMLALDDFVRGPQMCRLIELADFIKVDFRATPLQECQALAAEYGGDGISMLAEKVESQQEYDEARSMGYSYFQGYFFAKPQVISYGEVPATKLNHLRVLRELQHADLDLRHLEALVSLDLSLAPKVLRYVNSAAFPLNQHTGSVMQALLILGDHNSRKLITLAIMAGLVSNHPPELVWTSFTRARLCESIARLSGLAHRQSDCFLMGLFSLLDAIVGRPLADLLQELGMAAEILAAVTGVPSNANVFSAIYRLCLACEAGDMPEIGIRSRNLGLPVDTVSTLNLDAITWSEFLCRESGVRH
jgi:c-di-GMP-related signal transduction protein